MQNCYVLLSVIRGITWTKAGKRLLYLTFDYFTEIQWNNNDVILPDLLHDLKQKVTKKLHSFSDFGNAKLNAASHQPH